MHVETDGDHTKTAATALTRITMSPKTTHVLRGTGERRRSPGIHISVNTDLRAGLGVGLSTIYARRTATAPNPYVHAGGDL